MAPTPNSRQLGRYLWGLYAILPIPGKGLGLCAVENIGKGTRIVEDEVLLTISKQRLESDKALAIASAYTPLPESQKRSFTSLFARNYEDFVKLFDEIAFEKSNSVIQQVVSLQASRINHSCTPSVYRI